MKTDDLHKTVKALEATPVSMPKHQQALKKALLNYQAPKQTLGAKLQSAFHNFIGVTMSHKKTFFGAGTLAVAAVFALSVLTYNYTHSPRAEAEQLVSHGLGVIHTFGSGQMGQIQAQLGDDPAKALEEAQAAKDLTVLTDDQYKAEFSKHKGVATSSLGKDGPQYSSVGISANGGLPTGEGAANTYGQHFSTNGERGTSSAPEAGSARGTSVSTAPLQTFQANGSEAPAAGGQPEGPIKMPKPSKYLRYTNSTGHVVILGLNEKGVPINKTVFMTDAEVQNMQQNN